MDKYTKFILTIIAVGVLGLNYHLIKDDIFSPAHAVSPVHKISICNENGYGCAKVKRGILMVGKWNKNCASIVPKYNLNKYNWLNIRFLRGVLLPGAPDPVSLTN